MRFFTADLHLAHANIIKYCHRPFASVEDMDEALLVAWKAVVSSKNEVWVLGDLAFGGVSWVRALTGDLPGKKFLVPGDLDECRNGHGKDAEAWRERYEAAGFEVVDAPVEVMLAGKTVLLDHFPYQGGSFGADRYTARCPLDRGQWLLHGHVRECWRQQGRQVNVGVDAWRGRPVAESELAALIGSGPSALDVLPWRTNRGQQIEDLGLSHRARTVLRRNGVRTLGQLANLTEAELLNMTNFGEKCLTEVRAVLIEHGLSLVVPELESLGMSTRARRALQRNGVYTLRQLSGTTEAELLRITNFGEKCLAEAKALLHAHGLSLGQLNELPPPAQEPSS